MAGFLDQMAAGSRARADEAAAAEPLAALRARCGDLPPVLPLARAGGFDLIAELKLRSPALGELGSAGDDLAGRVTAYAGAGAAAVSVLTEPSRFSGSLGHLRAVAATLAPLGVPAMRKDFLVDPYQLYEARAAGAGGALLIVRMLSRAALGEMLDCARELGLFVLIETFDEADIAAAVEALDRVDPLVPGAGAGPGGSPVARSAPLRSASQTRSLRGTPPSAPALHGSRHDALRRGEHDGENPIVLGLPGADRATDREGGARTTGGSLRRDYPAFGASKDPPGVESPAVHDQRPPGQALASGAGRDDVLLGVNSRDLQTLAVVPERLEQLAPRLPREYPRVAESGLTTPDDAARMVRAGYDMALVGGALMSAPDPGALVRAMLAAGRAAAA
jgi:indole-3-glycerol phosphate synthase